jgi:dipeptidyl aminopeptidase/acylaminoacyl peptidase
MPKTFIRLSSLLLLIPSVLLASCEQQTANPAAEETPRPTATEELIPIVAEQHAGGRPAVHRRGRLRPSLRLHPGRMPLTRLTNGDWDDITPAPSPDGTKIAFASNRLGHWDLFLMDLASGELTRLTDTPEYEGAPTWSPDGTFLAYETYLNEEPRYRHRSGRRPLPTAPSS